MFIVPRATLLLLNLALRMFETREMIIKECVSELILIVTMAMVLLMVLNPNETIDSKVSRGWLVVFLVIANVSFNLAINAYMVWKLLNVMEMAILVKEDVTTKLAPPKNIHIDLFRTK